MGQSLKEQLAARPDVRQKEVSLSSLGGAPLTVTIRRLTVGERDVLMAEYKLGTPEGVARGSEAQTAIVCMALMPNDGETPTTLEEVRAMPAALVDEISGHVLDFNGWTKASKAALDDQFRPAAGSTV
jgi:hypothetical protein